MEQLLLERMLQQLACRGEGALLGRASGQMLDELLADTLCRHALRLSRRQSRVADSRVLGAAHRLNPNPNPNPNPNSNPNPNPNPTQPKAEPEPKPEPQREIQLVPGPNHHQTKTARRLEP